jgi:SAM-dependent methyltransferase
VRSSSGGCFTLQAIGGLLDHRWTIGDLGCGTGQLAAALAPFVARVVAVDRSAEMLAAARKRLRGWPSVELRRGDLEALPVVDGELDAATVMLVLHHVPDPAAVLRDAARALRRAGACWCSTCCRTIARSTGTRWATCGSGSRRIRCSASSAAPVSSIVRTVPLPVDAEAKGPALFAAAVGAGGDGAGSERDGIRS